MVILSPGPAVVGNLPDGSSLGEFVSTEVLGRADVGIVVDLVLSEISGKLFRLFEGDLTGKLHLGIQVVKLVVVLADKHVDTLVGVLETFSEGNSISCVVGGFVGELLVQLVFSQQVGFCEGLLVEMQADNGVVNSELIIGLLGWSDIPLVGNGLMGKSLSIFTGNFGGKVLGKSVGNFEGKELVGKSVGTSVGKLGCKLVGRLVGKELVGKFLGKERVGKLVGKEVVGKFLGKEREGKLVGKLVGKEVVGKFLGKERVGKRAPQLQLGLSLRLLLKIS